MSFSTPELTESRNTELEDPLILELKSYKKKILNEINFNYPIDRPA